MLADVKQPTDSTLALHRGAIIVDTHVDTIQRAVDLGHDLVHANPSGFMDLERMKAGNMTAAFFAVCVDYNNIRRGTGRQPPAARRADSVSDVERGGTDDEKSYESRAG